MPSPKSLLQALQPTGEQVCELLRPTEAQRLLNRCEQDGSLQAFVQRIKSLYKVKNLADLPSYQLRRHLHYFLLRKSHQR